MALTAAPVLAAIGLLAYGRVANAVAMLLCALPVGFRAFSPTAARRMLLVLAVLTPILVTVPLTRPWELNGYAYLALAGTLFVAREAVDHRVGARDPVVLFAVYLLLGGVFLHAGRLPKTAIGDYAMLLNGLWLYWLVRYSPEDVSAAFIKLFLALLLTESLIGICQSVFGFPVYGYVLPELAAPGRSPLAFLLPGLSKQVTAASGTFDHFNKLGELLALAAPILVALSAKRPTKVWRLVSLFLVAGALWFTYSRSAWIGAALGSGVVLWSCSLRRRKQAADSRRQERQRRQRIRVYVAVGVGLVVAASVLYIPLHAYYRETQNVSSRVVTYKYVWHYTTQSPIRLTFGAGFAQFNSTLLPAQIGETPRILYLVHNVPLQVFAEGGAIGLLLFVFAFAAPVAATFRRGASEQQVALGAALLAFLLAGLFGQGLFQYPGVLALGLLAVQRRSLDGQTHSLDELWQAGFLSGPFL